MKCSCGTKNLICFLQMLYSKIICPGLFIPDVTHMHVHACAREHTHTLSLSLSLSAYDIYASCTQSILTDHCPTVALSTITRSTLYAYLVLWSSELRYL
jgi:hypothetical protein